MTVKKDIVESTKLFAATAAAAADARIAMWDTKYTYLLWRPITAIPLGNG